MDHTAFGSLVVSAQGLGCMSMSEHCGPTDWDRATSVVHRVLDLGVSLLDTADVYGAGHNEVLPAERSTPNFVAKAEQVSGDRNGALQTTAPQAVRS